jgi:hypothetical protein
MHILFSFTIVVSVSVPTHILATIKYVSYSFSVTCILEEALACGAVHIPITGMAPETDTLQGTQET